MASATEGSNPPEVALSLAERTYQQHVAHLWPWTGWYALVVSDRFVGVFPTLWAAVAAVSTVDAVDIGPDAVLVRQIGDPTAVPTPSADGGLAA